MLDLVFTIDANGRHSYMSGLKSRRATVPGDILRIHRIVKA